MWAACPSSSWGGATALSRTSTFPHLCHGVRGASWGAEPAISAWGAVGRSHFQAEQVASGGQGQAHWGKEPRADPTQIPPGVAGDEQTGFWWGTLDRITGCFRSLLRSRLVASSQLWVLRYRFGEVEVLRISGLWETGV